MQLIYRKFTTIVGIHYPTFWNNLSVQTLSDLFLPLEKKSEFATRNQAYIFHQMDKVTNFTEMLQNSYSK